MDTQSDSSSNSSGARGGDSSSNSSGNSSGARGVDSSRSSPGEQRGARYFKDFPIEYRISGARGGQESGSDYQSSEGARHNSEQSSQSGQPIFISNGTQPNQDNNMYTKEIVPCVLPTPGFGYGAPVAPAVGGLGVDFYSYNAALMASENACRAIEATKESEADIKDSIHEVQGTLAQNQMQLLERICDGEKEAIKAGFEARLEAKETKADLLARIEECCCDMKIMNLELTNNMNTKFCDLERRQDKEFDRIREREDKREISQLRESLSQCNTRENNRSLASEIVSALQCSGIIPTPVHTH
jgi:hypothetical protein